MNQLQKYEPLVLITTYGDKTYYIKKAYEQQFLKTIESNRFVKVEGAVIASRDIRSIENAKQSYSVSDVPPEYRESIESRAKKYREKTGRSPESETVASWVVKLQNGESLN